MDRARRLELTLCWSMALVASAPHVAHAQRHPASFDSSATRSSRVERAQARAAIRERRLSRDRWSMTLGWGGSIGVAGPLGLVGTFVEFRPWRYVALDVGVGGGGSFGPALGARVMVEPLSFRRWSLGVSANGSMNVSILRGAILAGRRELPNSTGWLGLGAQVQIRPSRTMFVRVGLGYQWLLDVQRFRLGTDDELALANLPRFFFATPLDAVRAASRDEHDGLPHIHVDFGTYWRL